MPKIELTPEQAEKINLRNPAALAAAMQGRMEDAIAASTPGGIIAQEAAGQRMLVENGALLPKDFGRYNPPTREQVTAATGIVFGEDHDDLFVKVTLPKGWCIVPTDHNMWTTLLDEQGGQRASIFYKAAFYDRNAHISFNQRYVSMVKYDDAANTRTVSVRDQKLNTDIYVVGTCSSDAKDYKEYDRMQDEATAWIKAKYPDHRNPFAYWND